MHARYEGHSEWTTHSGRQSGGNPKNPGWHEQTGLLFISLQIEFGPHGLPAQGWIGFGVVTITKK